MEKYIRVGLTFTDKANKDDDSKLPKTKKYKLKKLDEKTFPKDKRKDGTEISFVQKCKSSKVHCYEFDLDNTVKLSDSPFKDHQKELKLEVLRCDKTKFQGCAEPLQVNAKINNILIGI